MQFFFLYQSLSMDLCCHSPLPPVAMVTETGGVTGATDRGSVKLNTAVHTDPIIVRHLYLCRTVKNTILQSTWEGTFACVCYAVMTLLTEVWEGTVETPTYLVLNFLILRSVRKWHIWQEWVKSYKRKVI